MNIIGIPAVLNKSLNPEEKAVLLDNDIRTNPVLPDRDKELLLEELYKDDIQAAVAHQELKNRSLYRDKGMNLRKNFTENSPTITALLSIAGFVSGKLLKDNLFGFIGGGTIAAGLTFASNILDDKISEMEGINLFSCFLEEQIHSLRNSQKEAEKSIQAKNNAPPT